MRFRCPPNSQSRTMVSPWKGRASHPFPHSPRSSVLQEVCSKSPFPQATRTLSPAAENAEAQFPWPTSLESRGPTPREASRPRAAPHHQCLLKEQGCHSRRQRLCPQLPCSGAGVLPRGKTDDRNKEVFGSA